MNRSPVELPNAATIERGAPVLSVGTSFRETMGTDRIIGAQAIKSPMVVLEDLRNVANTQGTQNSESQPGTPAHLGELEDLYVTMMPTVYRFAVARLGQSDGEEVTAEVFHAAAVAFNDGRSDHVTPAWLMAVARNKVIDRWRKAQRRNAIALLHRPRPEDLMSFPQDWSEPESRQEVMVTLDSIKPRHRAVLIAHYVDGMTAPELAEALGASTASIESLLARARRSFRKAYGEVQR